MKVLILGSGGREHALAWAVKRSDRVTEVVCAPGNGGIAQVARCVPVDLKDVDAMVRLAEAEQPAPHHRRPGAAPLARHRRRAPAARPARLRPNARSRHARIQQGLRQAVHEAPPDSHGQLRRLHQRRRGRKSRRASFTRPSSSRPTDSPPAKASSSAPRAIPRSKLLKGSSTARFLAQLSSRW